MKKRMFTLVAGLLVSCAWTLTAQAQLARTFVSTTGNDANTCDRDAPCRNFNEAISRTTTGGEVTALDSGSFGYISVRKSMTIQGAPGAAVMVNRDPVQTPVVIVNVEAGMRVVLRNLQISKPQGDGPNKGIDFRSPGTLHVENCIISGFDTGIYASFAEPTSPPDNEVKFFVKDTMLRGNAIGIQLEKGVKASIENCRIENNSHLGLLLNNSYTTISNSLVSGSLTGIEIRDAGVAFVETCQITNNNQGIVTLNTEAPGQGLVYVSNTGIAGNDTGVGGSGYKVSFGNNRFAHNYHMNGTFTETRPQQ
jgi:parallel beta-helix repeat protein